MPLHANTAFAPLDLDLHLERIAGGNETEVYRTDDHRYVVKLKTNGGGTEAEAFAYAQTLRAVAEEFARVVGSKHSIPNYYIIARDNEGQAQTVAIQPFLRHAQPLFEVAYADLSRKERQRIAVQLRRIIRQALKFYRRTSRMPDLYGRTSRSEAERKRLNAPHMLPWRLWSFIVKRNLLRANNLMLTEAPERWVVLVDYDPVERSRLYQLVYYTVRRVLFVRDYLLILAMELFGYVPRA